MLLFPLFSLFSAPCMLHTRRARGRSRCVSLGPEGEKRGKRITKARAMGWPWPAQVCGLIAGVCWGNGAAQQSGLVLFFFFFGLGGSVLAFMWAKMGAVINSPGPGQVV